MATNKISLGHTFSTVLFTIVSIVETVQGQGDQTTAPEVTSCGYGAGAMAAAIILTFVCTVVLVAGFLYWWKRRQDGKQDNHLILESDPERGVKAEYAFDNPGFKDASIIATTEKSLKPESNAKTKWNNWSPLSALNLKPEKKRALDDLALENHEVKVVALKSQDFTGLGFNICGNMKEGIYIKDILHRGPAFESGKLNPGDRINSVTISFEHMVYEDALTILSYASPYEVMIEAKGGRFVSSMQGQGQNPVHPVYRSSSLIDLYHAEKSAKKKLFGDDYSSSSNYSSLQKSRSNVTTLERKESKSPRPNQSKQKRSDKSPHKMTPEITKTHLEPRISEDDTQKIENNRQTFGVRVLPIEIQQKSPKIIEQNQNNLNIERMEEIPIQSIDEVDVTKRQAPQARKREKKSPEPAFERHDSGIKRNKDGIPLEIPDHMLDAAVMARRNRKSSVENGLTDHEDMGRKTKGKAPSPPSEVKLNFSMGVGKTKAFEDLSSLGKNDFEHAVRYGSDSEEEIDNTMSSVNTIELNSGDITIHQTEEEERKARKTASTGDLSRMNKAPRSNTGTLERAQSLDITDTTGPTLTKMRNYDATENLLIDREPRLSLILDGLTTFQRNKLKKSTEWGDLEDAILNFKKDEDDFIQRRKSEPQFNAVMDRVIQIKRESDHVEIIPDEIARQYQRHASDEVKPTKVKNSIWPDEEEIISNWKRTEPEIEPPKKKNIDDGPAYMRRQQVPVVPERTKIKVNEPKTSSETLGNLNFEEKHEKEVGEKTPLPAERVLSEEITKTGPKQTVSSSKSSSLIKVVNQSISVEKEEITKVGPKQAVSSSKTSSLMNVINQPISVEKEEITKVGPKQAVSSSKTSSLMNVVNQPISVEFECIKPVDPKRDRTPEKETVIDLTRNRNLQPVTTFEKQGIKEACSQIAKSRHPEGGMIKDEWEVDALNNTSPPPSMTLVDEVMDSYNRNYGNAVTVVQTDAVATPNLPDETKTVGNLKSTTANFIFNEQSVYETDTNIPDDVKVSRSSYESLEIKKNEVLPKSDDAKTEDLLVTNVTVKENGASNLHSLELSINNEPNELYTTALDSTVLSEDTTSDVTVIMSKPETVMVEIIENSFSKVTKSPESHQIKVDGENIKEDFKVEITESKYSSILEVDPQIHSVKTVQPILDEPMPLVVSESNTFKGLEDESPAISLTEIRTLDDDKTQQQTFITEIQVITPNRTNLNTVTEEKVTTRNNDEHLESAFENYVKNFEENKKDALETVTQTFESSLEDFINEPKSIVLEEKNDVEMQVSKIQEIAEEQLKTLPEMRFSTSSYESSGRKTPEKRHSFELLRSNFEKASNDKSPPRRDSNTPPKSRIPIATTMKTPPMSPERRDSRNLEIENDTAILELMSSSAIHSTPFTSKIKPPSVSSKNVSVTSIKNNSKIPSGLPTLSSRPPIPPRKGEDVSVQVSTNGGVESSFKQWVFNPNNNVTNVTVGKEK